MRILHVNKFLYRRGGAEGYMLDLADLQRAQGHEVELFGMRHEADETTHRFQSLFPPQVDLDPTPDGAVGKVRSAARMIWSSSSRARDGRRRRAVPAGCRALSQHLPPALALGAVTVAPGRRTRAS